MSNADNGTATASTFTKTIWVCQKGVFEKKIAHLNRMLAKEGKEPITFKYANYRTEKVTFQYHMKGESYRDDEFHDMLMEVCDAVCTGVTMVKKTDKNYEYIGAVSVEDGIRQVFCKNEDYKRYFTEDFREGVCDHCGTKRYNRKLYFLFLEQETGRVLQIGSKCAKEFFGIDSSAFLETYGRTFMLAYAPDDEEFADYNRGARCFDYESVLPVLSYCTSGFMNWNKKGGYFSPELPIRDWPTTMAVENILTSTDNGMLGDERHDNNVSLLSPNEAVAYWDAKYQKDGTTFAYNCLNAIKAGYATKHTMGTFCYAIFGAFNAKVRQIQEKAAASKEYVPCAYAKGSRADITGKIINVREYETTRPYSYNWYNGYWGDDMTCLAVDFKDDNGTLYHFSTSAKTFFGLKAGDRISMRCTIGETKPFRGVPYTRVSRPVATLLERNKADA